MSDLLVRGIEHGARPRLEAIAAALADATDAKGRYHPSHCHGVARLAQVIGAHMAIAGDALFRLRIAGLLHDVGKLHVPDSILLKPGALSDSEFEAIKRHPIEAHEKLVALDLSDEARWVLHHHERLDGGGYPTGLHGESIPLGSRILAVADAYDVMVSRRTYKEPVSRQQALSELRACVGTQFDGQVVEALTGVLERGAQITRTIRPTAGV